jgi:hypothetical protein
MEETRHPKKVEPYELVGMAAVGFGDFAGM